MENLTIEQGIEELLEKKGSIDMIINPQHIKGHVENILNMNGDLVIGEVLTRFQGDLEYFNNYRHIVFPVILSDENSFKVLKTIFPDTTKNIIPNSEYQKHSVNIKPANLLHADFNKEIIKFRNEILDITKVICELTEYSLGDDDSEKESVDKIKYIKHLGFAIAIDDLFFTLDNNIEQESQGFKNFKILLSNGIIPEYIKIDGVKLEALYMNRDNPKFEPLIERYKKEISKLKKLGCIVIGEWIKNGEDAEFASSLGCDLFQGQSLKPSHFKNRNNIDSISA